MKDLGFGKNCIYNFGHFEGPKFVKIVRNCKISNLLCYGGSEARQALQLMCQCDQTKYHMNFNTYNMKLLCLHNMKIPRHHYLIILVCTFQFQFQFKFHKAHIAPQAQPSLNILPNCFINIYHLADSLVSFSSVMFWKIVWA